MLYAKHQKPKKEDDRKNSETIIILLACRIKQNFTPGRQTTTHYSFKVSGSHSRIHSFWMVSFNLKL